MIYQHEGLGVNYFQSMYVCMCVHGSTKVELVLSQAVNCHGKCFCHVYETIST